MEQTTERTEQTGLDGVMLEAMMPVIVRRLATAALSLGADAQDSNGVVKAVVQKMGLDPFAWYAVCREIGDLQHNARRIGFIR